MWDPDAALFSELMNGREDEFMVSQDLLIMDEGNQQTWVIFNVNSRHFLNILLLQVHY